MCKYILLFFHLTFLCFACNQQAPVDYSKLDVSEHNAEIPSKQTLDNQNSNERVIWQKPEFVINQLGDISQKVIADIGAGSGFFSFRLLPKAKKIIAIDIDKNMIAFLDSMSLSLPKNLIEKFETRLATPNNSMLKPAEADVALIVNTYTYLPSRVQYLRNLKSCLTERATIMIVDYKQGETPSNSKFDDKLSYKTVKSELEEAGYKSVHVDNNSLEYQYIITASNN